MTKNVVVIAGATASGKSALALRLARETGGAVINADSMQVYRELSILTARPGAHEIAEAKHLLYGHVPAARAYAVADWLGEAHAAIAETLRQGRPAIVAGGTGLYLKALLEGLSHVPPIPAEIRAKWREMALSGDSDLHAELARRDAEMARRLQPADRQRIVRALEVIEATGRSLLDWQQAKGGFSALEDAMPQARVRRILVNPDRAVLRERIAARFDAMLDAGAESEVRALIRLDLSPQLPAMKAIGVREIGEMLAGRLTLDEARELAVNATRQYAKRQLTWFRGQMRGEWEATS
jgi:tRNA dimethylallyltransferase